MFTCKKTTLYTTSNQNNVFFLHISFYFHRNINKSMTLTCCVFPIFSGFFPASNTQCVSYKCCSTVSHQHGWPPDLYDQCLSSIHCSSRPQAHVADGGKEDGHCGELRTRDPAFVSNREWENHKKDRDDKVEVLFQIVQAKVGLCLLHIQAGFKPSQQRRQGTEVLPRLEKGGKEKHTVIVELNIVCKRKQQVHNQHNNNKMRFNIKIYI